MAIHPAYVDAPASTQSRLVAAWFRRKRLEARLVANEVGRMLGGAADTGGYDMIDEASALAALGVTPKHYDVRDHATTG